MNPVAPVTNTVVFSMVMPCLLNLRLNGLLMLIA